MRFAVSLKHGEATSQLAHTHTHALLVFALPSSNLASLQPDVRDVGSRRTYGWKCYRACMAEKHIFIPSSYMFISYLLSTLHLLDSHKKRCEQSFFAFPATPDWFFLVLFFCSTLKKHRCSCQSKTPKRCSIWWMWTGMARRRRCAFWAGGDVLKWSRYRCDMKLSCCPRQLSTTEFEHGVRLFAPSTALEEKHRKWNGAKKTLHTHLLQVFYTFSTCKYTCKISIQKSDEALLVKTWSWSARTCACRASRDSVERSQWNS